MRTFLFESSVVAAIVISALGSRGATAPPVSFPLDRTAYFVGEKVPLVMNAEGATNQLEAVNDDGRVLLWAGHPGALLLDTARLAPGRYSLELNGTPTGQWLFLASTLRRSAASMQDEAMPQSNPQLSNEERKDPALAAAKTREHYDRLELVLRETGLTACFAMAAHEMPRERILDTLARQGVMVFANPDTRPTSFNPPALDALELDGMSQRMVLTAQANGRYPNFGGFCYGWDPCGFADDARKQLLVYWGWGDKAEDLRAYCGESTRLRHEEFTRRTGLRPVSTAEYIAYLLSMGWGELAPAIDLPTKRWLEEMAKHIKPLPASERAQLERRLDAWSRFLMGLYGETYARYGQVLRGLDPTLRHSSSVQIDHCATRLGQYFPSAYQPLDFQYQSTWNDQVGGPDYVYQWLFTAGLLEMGRGEKPVWISNAPGATHGRTAVPGKFTRVAAHNLAYGASGIGFAMEAFGNLLGGMNSESRWEKIRHRAAGADVLAGREFLDRFAALALQGRADHGVGVLFSRSQLGRQHLAQGFGTPQYRAFVALARLGCTPRFVTEEEIAAQGLADVKALVIVSQAVPLPEEVMENLRRFTQGGGRIFVDGSTTAAIPGAHKLALSLPFSTPGKPHNWGVPNMARGENDTVLYERWHPELAAAFHQALGELGRGLLASEIGPASKTSLFQIEGGPDAKYVVAVNDSHIATQADWTQLRERLRPTPAAPGGGTLYDCTDEKPLGPLAPVVCDLSETTARVFAVLPRPLKQIGLAAKQQVRAGEDLLLSVEFRDSEGTRLAAVLPFHLSVVRPDGKVHQEFWRATSREGSFAMSVPLPANAPTGQWRLIVRSQLTGEEAALPIRVEEGKASVLAAAWADPVMARDSAAMNGLLTNGARFVLPLFDTPELPRLQSVAERVKKVLAQRGVQVEIRVKPDVTTWWLAYRLTPQQAAENARAERGEAIGRIKRLTVNDNDWFCGSSGYRFDQPLILLDLAGTRDNAMAEALDAKGLLWPQVDALFPGPGRAVVQPVHWAFGPRASTIILQAADVEGLMAGASALGRLPEDKLTPGIRAARASLFREQHVGGKPAVPKASGLTANGLTTRLAPRPFAIRFPDVRPPSAEDAPAPRKVENTFVPVPGLIEPGQFIPQLRVGDHYLEANSPGGLFKADLRFCDSVLLPVEVAQAGRTRLAVAGLFRYSDRRPRSQASWEEILALRDQLVPRTRLPMEIEVLLDGRTIGKLTPARTASREVPVETLPSYAKEKPKSVEEEVVIELADELELSSGRHEVLLIPRHMVDGNLKQVDFQKQAPSPTGTQHQPGSDL